VPDWLRPKGLPIGVCIGSVGVDAAWWIESARRLDEAGYTGIWCWDHFLGHGDRRTPVLESWTLLSATAATTSQATVGTFVANVMNRHPAVLGRMAATLQQVAGGRLVVGMGIGGHPAEHEALGIPFPAAPERAERLEEAVAVLRALWGGGPVDRESPWYPLRDAYAFPVPEPIPPIVIGGETPAGARLAARIGDGWTAFDRTFERDEPAYRDALAAAGRRREDVVALVAFESGRTGVDALRGSPWIEAPRDELARWQAAGADGAIVTARTSADIAALEAATGRW
jgi:alkanesulfonate monooxygenase SsuD/methylene tetrahydromethanopterin reductase-like flavin-dependent oxidoreductase (luciferase family)